MCFAIMRSKFSQMHLACDSLIGGLQMARRARLVYLIAHAGVTNTARDARPGCEILLLMQDERFM
jgi:hypothetical protein